MSSKISKFKLFFGNFLVLSLIVVAIEYSATLSDAFVGYGDPNKKFRLTRPEPYRSSYYFSAEFLDESFGFARYMRNFDGIVVPLDYSGKYCNIVNSYRVTSNQPSEYKSTIYIFGGSSIFGAEVPDELTVSSYLQRILIRDSRKYKVVNAGVSGATALEALVRLKSIPLKGGDIVLFVDGWNDTVKIIYSRDDIQNFRQTQSFQFDFPTFVRRYMKYSATLQYLDKTFMTQHTLSCCYDVTKTTTAIGAYFNEVERARTFVNQRGADFAHFLQPNLFSKNRLNVYEHGLASSAKGRWPEGIGEGVKILWPDIVSHGISRGSINLTDAFDNLASSPYLDPVHTTEFGNERISELI